MSGVYARYNGEWYTVSGSGGSGGSGSPAVVSGHNGATVQSGVTIDGKTYDVYTFSEATTFASVTLTTEAREAIAEAELPDTEGFTIPDGFDGDPAELIPEDYREVVKSAFDVIPTSDPGLSITFSTPGLVDLLAVGGGGGGGSDQGRITAGGGGGCVRWGMFSVESDTAYPVTVGAGGPVGTYDVRPAGTSSFGDVLKCGGGLGGMVRYTSGGWNQTGFGGGGSMSGQQLGTSNIGESGGGAGGLVYGSDMADGLPVYITGQEQIYGRGGFFEMPAPVANRGDAGFGSVDGSAGIVIVRVEV